MSQEKNPPLNEAKYSVDVEGLPRFYMDADSPAQVKVALRKLLKKASSIDSVERVNDARIKADLRQRLKGADTDKRYVDEKLDPRKDDAGDYVKDFRKSDAPQFKGKSDKKKREMAIAAYLADKDKLKEDLRKWFGKGKKGDWVRVGTDGEIKGDCARDPGEGKPKCMPRSKAHSMSKDDRASAARRKRRADPEADRPGTGNKPIMVKTDKEKKKKVKEEFELAENYRTLARHGMGTETKMSARVGTEIDYYDGSGSKRSGKITKMGPKSYIVKDDKDSKNRQFFYHDRAKAKELLAKHGKGKYNEEVELQEKNVPTKPALWAKFKAQAKAKFDVYPSAYANGWAAKQYKAAGGGWKKVSEEVELDEAKVPAGMKFMGGYDYKGTKHTYYRKGNKMTDPVVVHIDGKEWKEFKNLPKAKAAALVHIKSMKEEIELDEAKKMKRPSKAAISRVMGPTKNINQAYDAVMKRYKVDKETAKTWVRDVYNDAMKAEEVELDEGNIQISFRSAADKRKWMKKQSIAVKEIVRQTPTFVELPADFKKYAKKEDHPEIYQIKEAAKFTDKQIKMAYGILNDPRVKGGNYSAAVRKIEGIARGLSKHPGVARALRVTNESFEVKYAKNKRGPIKVSKFKKLEDAKEFLATVKADGMNGIISKGGKPVKEETAMLKFSQFVSEGYGKKKMAEDEDGKTTCTKCDGDGCDHCDDKGYHMDESSCGGSRTKKEELSPAQKKHMDQDKDGDIDGADMAALRAKKKDK